MVINVATITIKAGGWRQPACLGSGSTALRGVFLTLAG